MRSLSFEPALGLLDTERNTGETEKELARSRPCSVFGVAVDYDVTLQSSFDCKKPVMNLVLISTLYHQYIFILLFLMIFMIGVTPPPLLASVHMSRPTCRHPEPASRAVSATERREAGASAACCSRRRSAAGNGVRCMQRRYKSVISAPLPQYDSDTRTDNQYSLSFARCCEIFLSCVSDRRTVAGIRHDGDCVWFLGMNNYVYFIVICFLLVRTHHSLKFRRPERVL